MESTERKEEPIVAGYSGIPDHSDLRGFSYRAPSNFDYRDDFPKSAASFWQKIFSRLTRGGQNES